MSGYISGHDYSTSTFQPEQVTEDTTPEEDARYIGQIRTAQGYANTTKTNNDFLFTLFAICIIITIIIIIIPFIANKKAD